jgi:hypothetical protein
MEYVYGDAKYELAISKIFAGMGKQGKTTGN